jgi:hypothetical protein
MNSTSVKYGTFAGLILSFMVLMTGVIFENPAESEVAIAISKLLLIVALTLIYFGIKNHRDKTLFGFISFNQAFKTGIVVVIISAGMYTASKMIYGYWLNPDYFESTLINSIEKFSETTNQSDVLTDQEKINEITKFKANIDHYRKPYIMALMTFMEIFPMGLIISLICAILMKRKS